MRVLLDMDDEKFAKLYALQELPGDVLGTEHDMTFNSVFSSEDIWNRIQDIGLLDEETCAKIEKYGRHSFVDDVVEFLNKNFDANYGINWSSVDFAVVSVFDTFRDKLDALDQDPIHLNFHGLHQALSRHYKDLNGKGSYSVWTVASNSKRGLHNDFQIYYGSKPLVSAVVSEEPSPYEYFYIDLSRTSALSDESFKHIYDIVKSVYRVARIAPDEQEKMNEKIHSQENASLDLSMDGLHKALERFDSVIEDSLSATGICGSWEVSRYGKEASVPVFKIYYDGLPVVKSKIGSEFSSAGSKYIDLSREANVSDKTFLQICDVVKSVFMFARMSPDEQKRIQENIQSQSR